MKRDEFPIVDKHVKNEVNAVLNNLRAEIEQLQPYDYPKNERAPKGMIDKVLNIIDRYRNEVSK